MQKTILKYGLFVFVLVSGALSWFSVFNVSKISGADAWIFSIIFFSLFIIAMCLAAILVSQEIALEIVVAATFLLSLIFTFSLWYLGILLLAIILILSGLREIKKDLDLNINIDLWKSLYTGKFKIVLALAILISSQYFFMTNSLEKQKPVPKLDFSSITSKMIEPILSVISPNFRPEQNEDLTVDQFIIQSQQDNDGSSLLNQIVPDEIIEQQMPKNLPPEKREELKNETRKQLADSGAQILQKNNELILQQGRQQLSQMTGREITGNEKIADVFAGLIDTKINDFFQPKIKGDSQSSFYSYVVSAVLFLTIWPLGSIMAVLWFVIVMLIFKILVYFKWVEIKKITVEKEVIA